MKESKNQIKYLKKKIIIFKVKCSENEEGSINLLCTQVSEIFNSCQHGRTKIDRNYLGWSHKPLYGTDKGSRE